MTPNNDCQKCPNCGATLILKSYGPYYVPDQVRRFALACPNFDFRGPMKATHEEARLAVRERTAHDSPWYLLYDGSSADGLGPGTYVGRTDNEEIARAHYAKIAKNAYSTGYVVIITDREERFVRSFSQWPRPAQ